MTAITLTRKKTLIRAKKRNSAKNYLNPITLFIIILNNQKIKMTD